jgi:hypothetical protein
MGAHPRIARPGDRRAGKGPRRNGHHRRRACRPPLPLPRRQADRALLDEDGLGRDLHRLPGFSADGRAAACAPQSRSAPGAKCARCWRVLPEVGPFRTPTQRSACRCEDAVDGRVGRRRSAPPSGLLGSTPTVGPPDGGVEGCGRQRPSSSNPHPALQAGEGHERWHPPWPAPVGLLGGDPRRRPAVEILDPRGRFGCPRSRHIPGLRRSARSAWTSPWSGTAA